MTPPGRVGRIYKEDHYTLLHTKYESSGPCSFGEEDFFMFFPRRPRLKRSALLNKHFSKKKNSNMSNETAEIANFHFSHYKSMETESCHSN